MGHGTEKKATTQHIQKSIGNPLYIFFHDKL
jgi:hypothetical protein